MQTHISRFERDDRTLLDVLKDLGAYNKNMHTCPIALYGVWVDLVSCVGKTTEIGKAILLLDSQLDFEATFDASVTSIRECLNANSEGVKAYAELLRKPGTE